MKKANILLHILPLCLLVSAYSVTAQAKTGQKAEKYYEYEIKTGENGSRYAVIKGFREKYQKDIEETLHSLIGNSWNLSFPEHLGGVKVTGFSEGAFRDVPLGDFSRHLLLSGDIVSVGANCFENCGLTDVVFEKRGMEEDSLAALTVGDGAFADNPELWGVYFSDREAVLGSRIWEGCGEKVYICYASGEEGAGEKGRYFKEYASENQRNVVEIQGYYSDKPIIEMPETIWVLKPEVRKFFYGENGESTEEEDRFCSFEYDDDATDYGFPEWHVPCGEFCAMSEFICEITASSELPSQDGRYGAQNLGCDLYKARERAWAEGAEGYGIGESISITEACGYGYWQDDYSRGIVSFLEGDIEPDIYDGYIRYTEICVVNGYAKNQKAWEENGRVKRLLMYVEDEPYAYLELEDTIYPQYFSLPVDGIKAAQGVEVHFRFVIEDVYEGTKYEDTCLTGLVVDFMGRRGH